MKVCMAMDMPAREATLSKMFSLLCQPTLFISKEKKMLLRSNFFPIRVFPFPQAMDIGKQTGGHNLSLPLKTQ